MYYDLREFFQIAILQTKPQHILLVVQQPKQHPVGITYRCMHITIVLSSQKIGKRNDKGDNRNVMT